MEPLEPRLQIGWMDVMQSCVNQVFVFLQISVEFDLTVL